MVKWTFSILFSGATWCFFWSCRRTTLSPLKCDATCTVGGETSKCSDTRRLMGWKPRSRTIIDWRIWFQHVSTITTYPLVICYIAIENGYLYWIYPLKMVILDSYVSLPEGIITWGLLKTWNVFPKVSCWGARDHPTYRYFLTRGSQFRTSMIDMRYCGCEILH